MLDRKYERQMSGKEKRKLEAEKMRQMTLKEKIKYLWKNLFISIDINYSVCSCNEK